MNLSKLFIIALAPYFLSYGISKGQDDFASNRNETESSKTNSAPAPQGTNFAYASSQSRGSVVHIRTYSKNMSKSFQGSPFEEFFRDFYGDQEQKQNPQKNKSPEEFPLGGGSGVIISPDGHIITNNHIAQDAERIEVVLNDKRTYNATVIGRDPNTDMALIKINEKDLVPIKYGNSDEIQVGEWVLAVGNPFNLSSSVTAGIVSAKGRNLNLLREKNNMAIESFIQTDAAVNPGNSGGALVNIRGELIGINTAIASPTGSYAGYAFAVPVNLVRKVMTDLLKYGVSQRALLGVSIQDLDATLGKEKGITEFSGVYIGAVSKGSSADDAGLKEGDIIKKINGITVNSPAEVQEIIGVQRPGDKVNIIYKRAGKEQEATVKLKNAKGTTEMTKYDPNLIENKIGAELVELEKSEMKSTGITGTGIQVKNIVDGNFQAAGMQEGFIITDINKVRVRSKEELTSQLKNIKKGSGAIMKGVYPTGEKAFYSVKF